MTFLRKSGSFVTVWIKSLATAARYSFCSGSRSNGMNFFMTRFMPTSCVKILDTVVFGIPRSASSSRTVSHQSLLIAAHTHSTFSGVLLVAGLLERGSLSTHPRPSLKSLCHPFICAALVASSPKAFWIIQIVSTKECSSLKQDLLLYLLSHFECNDHTVHVFTQWHLPPLWPVQWNRHCSHMQIPVHSPQLPSYINVPQTILVIWTIAGLFPDRPCTSAFPKSVF